MATGTYDPNGIVAGDKPLIHESKTILSGQNLVRGAVLGMVTASKKYVLSLTAAVDGSQTPVGILAVDCDASGGDKVAPIYFEGEFASEKLTYGTGHTKTTVRDAFRAAAAPIYLRDIGTVA